jgi:hypothetical protein
MIYNSSTIKVDEMVPKYKKFFPRVLQYGVCPADHHHRTTLFVVRNRFACNFQCRTFSRSVALCKLQFHIHQPHCGSESIISGHQFEPTKTYSIVNCIDCIQITNVLIVFFRTTHCGWNIQRA